MAIYLQVVIKVISFLILQLSDTKQMSLESHKLTFDIKFELISFMLLSKVFRKLFDSNHRKIVFSVHKWENLFTFSIIDFIKANLQIVEETVLFPSLHILMRFILRVWKRNFKFITVADN